MSDVPLREHIDSQIQWVDRYFESRLLSVREAVEKAEGTLNRRLEGMNEFRDTLKDQAARLVTKDEMFTLVGSLQKRIEQLELSRSEIHGRTTGIAVLWAVGVSIAIAIILRSFKL